MGELFEKFVSWLMALIMGFVIGVGGTLYVWWQGSINYQTEDKTYVITGVVIDKHDPFQSGFFKPKWPTFK